MATLNTLRGVKSLAVGTGRSDRRSVAQGGPPDAG